MGLELRLSQWWRVVTRIIQESHTASGDDLPRVIDEAVGLVGMTAQMYLVDLAQRTLWPVPQDPEGAITVEGTLAGRTFQFGKVLAGTDPDAGGMLWLPMVDGTERLGVLRLGLPDEAGGDDSGLRQRCSVLAGLVGHLVATKSAYGDVLNVARRSTPLTVAAELLWQLLPPLTFASRDLVITAVLEPHDRVGGDGFDYAVDEQVAFCGLFDAVGHDLQAGLATAVALATIRNARRSGERDLNVIARRADAEIIAHGPSGRFVTAILARLDLSTGKLSYLVAGHPPPLLLRANRTVKALQYGRRAPLGVSGRDVEVVDEYLEPGDRLLLYTDGITEARDARGRCFGTDRLIDFAERRGADGLPAPETLRRLAHAVLEYQGGLLQDDATLLMVDWRPVNPSIVPLAMIE
ncbi:MAG: serine/threonine-protein phosphatase [Actinomycetota bacterium]|nr:serine/threonine-protein phosphatase [Actinomycetota bacterium]